MRLAVLDQLLVMHLHLDLIVALLGLQLRLRNHGIGLKLPFPADRSSIDLGRVQTDKLAFKLLLLSKHFRLKEFRNLLVDPPKFVDRH
jgi:hypothetical protein